MDPFGLMEATWDPIYTLPVIGAPKIALPGCILVAGIYTMSGTDGDGLIDGKNWDKFEPKDEKCEEDPCKPQIQSCVSSAKNVEKHVFDKNRGYHLHSKLCKNLLSNINKANAAVVEVGLGCNTQKVSIFRIAKVVEKEDLATRTTRQPSFRLNRVLRYGKILFCYSILYG